MEENNNTEEKNENIETTENTNEEVKQEEKEVNQENEVSSEDELNELNDRYKRLFAEFENYKKRTQKESLTKRAEITADVVMGVLPVVDNLEKAVEAKTDDTAYQDGVKLILKQLYDVLNRFGLEEIETVGQTFDPGLHDAVQHIDDESKGVGEIVQEYRKGYRIGTKVVRHAMVVVAN